MKLSVKSVVFAIGLVILLTLGLISRLGSGRLGIALVHRAQAQTDEAHPQTDAGDASIARARRRCTLRTIRGSYGGSAEGEFLPGNAQGAPEGPYRVIERITYDGEGHVTAYGIAGSVNGVILQDVPYPPASYTVNPDCSGAVSSPNGLAARFVIVNGGKEILWLSTTAGFVVSGVQKKL